jgi:hypothetical protein
MFQLSQQHRVADVQVGSGRIETRFHPQRTTLLDALLQALLQTGSLALYVAISFSSAIASPQSWPCGEGL